MRTIGSPLSTDTDGPGPEGCLAVMGAGATGEVVTVQRALGHSSATTTPNTDSHLWPMAEDRTRAAAAGLMKQALEATP